MSTRLRASDSSRRSFNTRVSWDAMSSAAVTLASSACSSRIAHLSAAADVLWTVRASPLDVSGSLRLGAAGVLTGDDRSCAFPRESGPSDPGAPRWRPNDAAVAADLGAPVVGARCWAVEAALDTEPTTRCVLPSVRTTRVLIMGAEACCRPRTAVVDVGVGWGAMRQDPFRQLAKKHGG